MRYGVFAAVFAVALSGCAHVISKDVLREVDRGVAFTDLRGNPDAYVGKTVLLGGVVVSVENKKEGTWLEVYQTALDREGRPTDTDVSGGRFLALFEGLLDGAVYEQGRRVTIAGVVKGARIMKLGELDYRYPYILVREIHLWKKERTVVYEPYPYPWGPWDPWLYPYPWRPWHYPYWRHRH